MTDSLSVLRVTRGISATTQPPRVYRGAVEVRDGFVQAVYSDSTRSTDEPSSAHGSHLGPADPDLGDFGLRVVPEGLYLRGLRKLDLESDDAIAQFTAQHGSLAGVDWSALVPPEWLGFAPDMWDIPTPVEIHKEAEKTFPMLREVRLRTQERSADEDYGFFHTDEFRIRAKLIRDMTRTWIAAGAPPKGDDEHVRARDRARREERVLSSWESTWRDQPTSLDEALWDWLVPLLNVALTPFHPRVVSANEPEEHGAYELYNVLCLQLARDIDEGREYSTCQHCGETYSRWHRAAEKWTKRLQEGDNFDIHKKRAKAMKYCRDQCCSAATSKAYRDKKREHKEHTTARQGQLR